MQVEKAVLREIYLPLLHGFETSFSRIEGRHVLLLELDCGDHTGWGECVADDGPFYSYETIHTAWPVLTRLILPSLVQRSWSHPNELGPAFAFIRGHSMAKACVEAALWDAWSKRQHKPLWKVLGGTRSRIECGVSIGIQKSPDILLEKIERELQDGYCKIKIKIKPGWDVDIVRLVRRHFPQIPLMVDANSAYRLEDAAHLRSLDELGLLMIEQPLAHDDLLDHSRLQSQIETPLCLDESICHQRDARHAIQLGACRIINIKMGRLGGHAESLRVHDACRDSGIPVWCGGMLETGIGRAHNIALSTLDNFSIPGDVSASRRYFERDTIVPAIEVEPDGCITPPTSPGIGYQPDREWIEELTRRRQGFAPLPQ